MPARWSRRASTRPAGPAPTIATWVSRTLSSAYGRRRLHKAIGIEAGVGPMISLVYGFRRDVQPSLARRQPDGCEGASTSFAGVATRERALRKGRRMVSVLTTRGDRSLRSFIDTERGTVS